MKKWYRLLRYAWPLHFILVLTNWLPDNVIFINLRGFLARPFFKNCGKGLGIGRNVCFYDSSLIEIGDDVYIACGCWMNGNIIIEDEVLFGPYCILASETHTRIPGKTYRFGGNKTGDIKVSKGSWLGAHSMLVGTSSLGKGSILAANSTLTHDSDDNALYGGTPAKKIKSL